MSSETDEIELLRTKLDAVRRVADRWKWYANECEKREPAYRPRLYWKVAAEAVYRALEAEVGQCADPHCPNISVPHWHNGPYAVSVAKSCPADPSQPCTPDRMCRRCAGPGNLPDIEELIENSSLGTPEAKEYRASISDEQVAAVIARAKEIENSSQTDAILDALYMMRWNDWAELVRSKVSAKTIAIAWGVLNGVLDAKVALKKGEVRPMSERIEHTGETYTLPRVFVLMRDEDISGVSGTGLVAWGVEFPDGRVATRWNSDVAQTCAWDSMEHVEKIHGHNGATRIVWLT